MADTALPKVLVVDAEVPIALQVAAKLAGRGFDVRVCHDGATALHVVREWSPDTVLLDDRMPGMSGREVCRRLLAEDWHGITIIYSGYDEPQDVVLALEAGAICCLPRSVRDDVLVAAIRRACKHTAQLRQLAAAARCGTCGFRHPSREAEDDAFALVDACPGHVERRLLCELLSAQGKLVSAQLLLREGWERENVPMNLLYERIRTLRRKLAPRGWAVQSRRGAGYRLVRAGKGDDRKHTSA